MLRISWYEEFGTATGALVACGVAVDFAGRSVWIDPWSKADLSQKPAADLLLITDIHFDHDDHDAAAVVTKEGTALVAPQAVADAKEVATQMLGQTLVTKQTGEEGEV